ncbi:MAG: ABC transporter ATP-binding protein [Candidatus Thermoplasmatota archaeon]|nr:ABC transporter ATP-binding protein [Candidatus Thermoplasmatota archaeon]
MEIISCEHVAKKFGNLKVIEDLSFVVFKGEFLSIVGPSGCGKTTVLRMISGLEKPKEGRVLFKGIEVSRPTKEIGFIFQEASLFPWRSVKKNIEFPLELSARENREEISRKYIELVGLEGFENAYPHQLSGGMKQRASLARALAAEPEVLLMDEPFASLDALSREKMQVELHRIWEKEKKTIIFVTHSVEEALFLSDRIIVLTSRPAEIKEDIHINLERPRDRGSEKFMSMRKSIEKKLI